RVAEVIRGARARVRIVVAGTDLLVRRDGLVVLALLVVGVAEIEVQERRVGMIDQRLVVLLRRVVVLAGGEETIALARARMRVEPGDRREREDERRHQDTVLPGAFRGRTAGALVARRCGGGGRGRAGGGSGRRCRRVAVFAADARRRGAAAIDAREDHRVDAGGRAAPPPRDAPLAD